MEKTNGSVSSTKGDADFKRRSSNEIEIIASAEQRKEFDRLSTSKKHDGLMLYLLSFIYFCIMNQQSRRLKEFCGKASCK